MITDSGIIIGIAGGSGSGKTHFCQELLQRLGTENAALLTQDHYYRGHGNGPLTPEKISAMVKANYDHPDAIEFELLAFHIKSLRNKLPVEIPVYDFTTHSRLAKTETIKPRPFIIVEGILLFSQPRIQSVFDYMIYVDVPDEIRFNRRLARDQIERGRTYESVLEQFDNSVNPMHKLFVEPSSHAADIVISGEDTLAVNIRKVAQGIRHKTGLSLNLEH